MWQVYSQLDLLPIDVDIKSSGLMNTKIDRERGRVEIINCWFSLFFDCS